MNSINHNTINYQDDQFYGKLAFLT